MASHLNLVIFFSFFFGLYLWFHLTCKPVIPNFSQVSNVFWMLLLQQMLCMRVVVQNLSFSCVILLSSFVWWFTTKLCSEILYLFFSCSWARSRYRWTWKRVPTKTIGWHWKIDRIVDQCNSVDYKLCRNTLAGILLTLDCCIGMIWASSFVYQIHYEEEVIAVELLSRRKVLRMPSQHSFHNID